MIQIRKRFFEHHVTQKDAQAYTRDRIIRSKYSNKIIDAKTIDVKSEAKVTLISLFSIDEIATFKIYHNFDGQF